MRHLPFASMVLFAATTACTAAVDDGEIGSASVAITSVPADVACIALTATGSRTVTRNYDVVAGQSSVLALNSLPVGTVSFRGDAYTGACSTVTATTTPTFVAEPVDAVVTTGGVTPVTLMMRRNGQSSVSVDWEDPGAATHALTVARVGSGSGSVVSMPAGINCGLDCTEAFTSGSVVTLSAVPATGSSFAGWSGGGCTGTGTCTVTMIAAATVTATFTTGTNTLSVNRAGTGTGIVSSAPAGISCGVDCTEAYASGTMVTLTATPSVSSNFTGWSGGGCSGTGTCTVTMTSATNVTATFTIMTFPLNISVTGNGTVTSTPGGINCPGDCSELYAANTMVTLTATPNNPFSFFQGWSGACTGSGSCTVSMTSARNVQAVFVP